MRFQYLFFGLFVLFMVSCSDDDGDGGGESTGVEFAGSWQITAITVSSAIDINNDGVTSTNLLDEADCLMGTLQLNSDFTFTASTVTIELLTAITGNLYALTCSDLQNTNGNWGVQAGQLFLVSGTSRPFTISGTNQLTELLGNDLPGIQSVVYTRLDPVTQ
ncbi:hypothetical protein MTsPCn5_27900 [Croceitalea sp. MTPC5]|uniref:hypothetical protein n=1 Tax=Croceitalea sp. MTPC5 TaxID=3056565 RepID=UPI002B3D11D3|nr:hypothetical protein MTsPCn5_27900 [Croceitalea sp. MTPC5]